MELRIRAAWFCSTDLFGVVASFIGVSASPTLGRTFPVFCAPVPDDVFNMVPVNAVEAAVRSKSTRTVFDLTAASTALTGTILNTSSGTGAQNTGKVLPSVGLALTPIKEATTPNRSVEQNQAALIRSSIKRLDYMVQDNELAGEKDPDIIRKTATLKNELKQVQVQLIDVPVEITNEM